MGILGDVEHPRAEEVRLRLHLLHVVGEADFQRLELSAIFRGALRAHGPHRRQVAVLLEVPHLLFREYLGYLHPTLNIGEAAEIFRTYASLLKAAGHEESKSWPYAYGRFTNGRPISNRARQIYRGLGDEAEKFGDPHDAGRPDSFFVWSKSRLGAVATLKRVWWGALRVGREVRRALALP